MTLLADDLVARLRNPLQGDHAWTGKSGLFWVAADEIEALREVLGKIVHEYDQTYDAECDLGGAWKAAAQIPFEVMAQASALVKR